MRFLTSARGGDSREDVAAIARLNAVTNRGKIEVSDYPGIEAGQRPCSPGRFEAPAGND